LANGDIALHHIHQVVAHGAKLVPGLHLGPHFGGRVGRRGSVMVPFERVMVVSYRLSIVTIALSLTIRPQFAMECLQPQISRGVGYFGAEFGEEEVDRC